jgi:hypothetical protein
VASSPGRAWLLPLVLALAIGTGIAAALLASVPSAAPAPSRSTEVVLPFWLVFLPVLAIFVVSMVALVARRVSGGSVAVPNPIVASILIAILLLCGFVVLAHFLSPGPMTTATGGNTTTGSNNSTGGGNPGTGNLTGPGGGLGFLHFPDPSLLPWLVVILIGGVAAVVLAPVFAQRLGARSRLDAGANPRTTILVLYGRLLEKVVVRVGPVDDVTADEIRTRHLVRLGVQAGVAAELTSLFEEARYSSHPMDADAADRARTAIRRAEDDLAREPIEA